MQYRLFDKEISKDGLTSLDRAIAFLWLAKNAHGVESLTAKELASIVANECGHPHQNASRLHTKLASDRRTSKFGISGFRLRPSAESFYDNKYSHLLEPRSEPVVLTTGSVIPRAIFCSTGRTYLLRLVDQVNGCYDHGFHDGVTVLGRKLLETLCIEVYVQSSRADEIKRPDGNFLTFEDISGKISVDSRYQITRETKKALASIKKLGDQSAHNPRFTARSDDVEGVKFGLRVAAEELLHLCAFN